MKFQKITTALGEISISLALSLDPQSEGVPLVFMHGIFLDKTLWFDCSSKLTHHRRIYIDMPAHGQSSDVGRAWGLNECSTMLIQILDALAIESCIAIGHSWGAMVALETSARHPERFQALGLFNMPFQSTTGMRRLGFRLQMLLANFPRFYGQQAAQSMYSQACLKARPELSHQMQDRLGARSGKEIAQVITAVILEAGDSRALIQNLTIPLLVVIGESDFVGRPPGESRTVPGRHISPQEAPKEVELAIQDLIHRTQRTTPK